MLLSFIYFSTRCFETFPTRHHHFAESFYFVCRRCFTRGMAKHLLHRNLASEALSGSLFSIFTATPHISSIDPPKKETNTEPTKKVTFCSSSGSTATTAAGTQSSRIDFIWQRAVASFYRGSAFKSVFPRDTGVSERGLPSFLSKFYGSIFKSSTYLLQSEDGTRPKQDDVPPERSPAVLYVCTNFALTGTLTRQ